MLSPDSPESHARKLNSVDDWFNAIETNNLEAIKASVSRFKGSRMPSGDTALMIAANRGNFTLTKVLYNYEARLQNNDGLSALMYATLAEQINVVELLVGMEKECVTPEGRDALMLGSEAGCSDIVAFLLNHIPVRTDKYSRGALFYATSNLHVTTIRVLLESGKMPQSHIRDALTATADTEVIAILSEYLVPDASYTSVSKIGTPLSSPRSEQSRASSRTSVASSTAIMSESTKMATKVSASTRSSSVSRSSSGNSASARASFSGSNASSVSSGTKKSGGSTSVSQSSLSGTEASRSNSASSSASEKSVSESSSPTESSAVKASSRRSSSTVLPTTVVSSSEQPTTRAETTIVTTVRSSSPSSPVSSPIISVTSAPTTRDVVSFVSTQLDDSKRETVSPPIPRAVSATPNVLQAEGSILYDQSHDPHEYHENISSLARSVQELEKQLHARDAQIAALQADLQEADAKKQIALDAAKLAKEALIALQQQTAAENVAEGKSSQDASALAAQVEKLQRELDIMRKGYNALASSKAEFAEIIEDLKLKLAEHDGANEFGRGSVGSAAGTPLRRSPGLNGISLDVLRDLQQQLQSLADANYQLNSLLNDKSLFVDRLHEEMEKLMRQHASEIQMYKARIRTLTGQEEDLQRHSPHGSEHFLQSSGRLDFASSGGFAASDYNNQFLLPDASSSDQRMGSYSHHDGSSIHSLQSELDVMRKVSTSMAATLTKNQAEIIRLRTRIDALLREQNLPLKPTSSNRSTPQLNNMKYSPEDSKSLQIRSPSQPVHLSPAGRAELEQLREKMHKKDVVLKALEKLGKAGNEEEMRPMLLIVERYLQTGENEADISLILRLLALEEENLALKQRIAFSEDSGTLKRYTSEEKILSNAQSAQDYNYESNINVELAMTKAADLKRSLNMVADVADTISSNIIKMRSMGVSPSNAINPQSTLRGSTDRRESQSDLTPLMASIFHGDIEGVKRNIQYAGSTRADGTTALMIAAQYGFSDAIPLLLPTEARMRRRDNATALSLALKTPNNPVAELLRTAEGFDVHGISCLGGRTTELMQAAERNDVVAVWSLLPLQSGLQDASGHTALMYAAEAGSIDAARFLAPYEAKLSDFEGHDAMYWVTASRNISSATRERFAKELVPYLK